MPKEAIYTDRVGKHIPQPMSVQPLWSLGVKAHDLVFTCGQPGVDGSGRIVGPGDVKAQTVQALENLKAILEAAGMGLEDVARFRYFLRNLEDYPKMNEARVPYMERYYGRGGAPASTALVAPVVIDDLLVEIEAIACRNKEGYSTPKIYHRIPLDLPKQPLWSLGMKTGDLLWVTGQPGLDVHGNVAGNGDIALETRQALQNVKDIVEAGGFHVSDIVRLNTFLSRASDYRKVLGVRSQFLREHFPNGDYPASTTTATPIVVSKLSVEIEAIAYRGPKTAINTEKVVRVVPQLGPDPILFSHAVRAGNFVFVSGMGSLDARGHVVGRGDIRAQTRQSLLNVALILEAGGLSFEDVIYAAIWLSRGDLYEAMNEERVKFYKEQFKHAIYPASTAVVGPLPFEDLLIEVDAIAAVP